MSCVYKAVILGDSFNNTLGLIRSLGEKRIPQTLILVGEEDRLFVARSRYLRKEVVYRCGNLAECLPLLQRLADGTHRQVILCTNDAAATFVDQHEEVLSPLYITPMSGKHLEVYLNKEKQCELAAECGFDVPKSLVYHKGDVFPDFPFPLLLKPLVSVEGEKSDIHICMTEEDLQKGLSMHSHCTGFLVQEFIEKEYEINLIGVSTRWGIRIPGGIQKIRHYPTIYSPCSFGLYQSIGHYRIGLEPIQRFMDKVGYRGPFSVELLHKKGKNYFMEVNFRHDGLAYTATAAGDNLPALYMQFAEPPTDLKVRDTYMMDLSIDYCHVKDGTLPFGTWFSDFCKTGCQLNFNRKDMAPTFYYYWNKVKRKFVHHPSS